MEDAALSLPDICPGSNSRLQYQRKPIRFGTRDYEYVMQPALRRMMPGIPGYPWMGGGAEVPNAAAAEAGTLETSRAMSPPADSG